MKARLEKAPTGLRAKPFVIDAWRCGWKVMRKCRIRWIYIKYLD